MKRYSSIFKKRREGAAESKSEEKKPVIDGPIDIIPKNGYSNGIKNGSKSAAPSTPGDKSTRRHSSFGFGKKEKDDNVKAAARQQPNHNTSRGEVESAFKQYAQLIHAAKRPLPNQTGDGTYI